MAKARRKNGIAAALLFAVAGGMVGMAFASVPLYQWFCRVTGFAGTPNVALAPAAGPGAKGAGRAITVRFDANVDPGLAWRFQPDQLEITIRAGEPALAFYTAENRSAAPITGTATFNVTPYKAGIYFSKTDCFCFTEQTLAAGEAAAMGVEFFVDPAIFDDPNTREITAITLSYTFFRVPGDDGDASAKQAARPAPVPPAQARPAQARPDNDARGRSG